MIISLIAAMDKNRLIGNGLKIPWNLPADQRHFRKLTIGKPVVMGRKTFETLKRPLDKRLNIILTRNLKYKVPTGCLVVHSVDEILKAAINTKEIMICGGSPVYEEFLPYATRFYLTKVHAEFEGDIYFPDFDISKWNETKRIDNKPDKKNPHAYSFHFLERSI